MVIPKGKILCSSRPRMLHLIKEGIVYCLTAEKQKSKWTCVKRKQGVGGGGGDRLLSLSILDN